MKLSEIFIPGKQGWYVVEKSTGTVANGPYPSRETLEGDLKKMPWYDPEVYTIDYGEEDDDYKFKQLDEGVRQALAAAAMSIAAIAHAPTHGEPQSNYRTGMIRRPEFDHREDHKLKKLVKAITSKYKIEQSLALQIAELARKHEKNVFPKAEDILAVIGIESSFNPHAKSGLEEDPAIGLMQIRPGVWGLKKRDLHNLETNIEKGADTLEKYFKKLKKPEAAIGAYNIGLTNFLKGDAKDSVKKYLHKFEKEKRLYI